MIKLTNIENTNLSSGIRSLSPIQYDSIQVKNRLLDGSYHVQSIGTPARYLTFEILATFGQVDMINTAESIGESLKLIADDKVYIGLISKEPNWKRFTKDSDYYVTSLKFNIQSEGVV